ncbi:aminotransferase class V-fold PLP-dependent enzyme [Asaccharospora irregularis]|uniref:cysteine desulfurase n=1 Tax=Asaccharospora irregularis DSM 2635 TaxID=1121321 RepID=A0A1M5MZ45_9FIRM|nr:aminotransferase class V-fold PLP-dependent enzyme [Asaccharospora irregularis]SHG82616.1 cysteine desulfurase family protein [Asaccharospora irregularis DSM 2635]
MKRVYCDNGATSYPKAPFVGETVLDYINNIGCNVNRGVYSTSFKAENTVYETRELICDLFNFKTAENVVFTQNITTSLNVVLKGLLREGDNVVVSSMEHNAVMRPLTSMKQRGVTITKVNGNILGEISIEDIENAISENTKAIVMTHASNVCGTVLPIRKIGELCKKYNKIFIVDSAQTAGVLDIDIKKDNIDILCFTGHKGLLGPQGIGGFLIKEELVERVSPLIEGGTGSLSELEVQPTYMPDKFESGTPNVPGIFGLNASLNYLLKTGLESIYNKEIDLTSRFIEKIMNIDEKLLIGKKDIVDRTAVVSLDFKDLDNGIVCHNLDKNYGISTRSGLHCAPSAHKTLNTFPRGTVRFSFGHFNSYEDIDYVIDSINKIYKTK